MVRMNGRGRLLAMPQTQIANSHNRNGKWETPEGMSYKNKKNRQTQRFLELWSY